MVTCQGRPQLFRQTRKVLTECRRRADAAEADPARGLEEKTRGPWSRVPTYSGSGGRGVPSCRIPGCRSATSVRLGSSLTSAVVHSNILIGLVAAAVSGHNYSQVLRQRVFAPLHMTRTSLPVGFRLPAPHVRGYVLSPPTPPTDVTTLLSMSGAWASGGIQSTAADLNRFIRGYVGRKLFGRATQRQQLRLVKGHSEPPGPGVNSAGLGIFRYETGCGTVYGHTGNLPGFTQFTAATLDGRRSVTVSANAQVVPKSKSAAVRAGFDALRRVDALAVCASLVGR